MRSFLVGAFVCIACALCALAPAQQLTDAQRSTIKSACRGDYMKVCSSVPTGTQASLQCLIQHSQDVSAGCQGALAPAMSGAAPAAATPNAAASTAPAAAAATPAAPSPGVPPAQQMSPRDEARLVRASCGSDLQKFCAEVRLGGGRALSCLRAHAADLSPSCQSTLSSLAAAH